MGRFCLIDERGRLHILDMRIFAVVGRREVAPKARSARPFRAGLVGLGGPVAGSANCVALLPGRRVAGLHLHKAVEVPERGKRVLRRRGFVRFAAVPGQDLLRRAAVGPCAGGSSCEE
jgi:hypothetical protein